MSGLATGGGSRVAPDSGPPTPAFFGSGTSTPVPGGPQPPSPPPRERFVPLVTVVGFHHARGPEIESWFGVPDGFDPAAEYEWGLLPFMALSDGAHASEEDFSYFTLLLPSRDPARPATSLFGISCTRQLDASQLVNRPADVTRSTVQKAVVVIADSPQSFGMLRTRLGFVTSAWFAQREFSDTEILRGFQESLAEKIRDGGAADGEDAHDRNLGLSLRELVRQFKWQTLVLFKCCLLQRKMLFFGSRCDRLCMVQFSLISLIPNLIRNLQDCADPELNAYESTLRRSSSLRTSDRNSLLTYMGLPLQIFGKGSLFGPYTPLQQLDVLADFGTKSYIVGSTNSLLLQQKDRYSDILVNLDEDTINITSTSLRAALVLTTPDRRWIDSITSVVNDTWDESNPGLPNTHGFMGSEDFIRTQFEDYILSLISSVKYHNFAAANPNNPNLLLQEVEGNPVADFGTDWVDAWSRTENYRMWNANTDSHIFDICEPKHPAAGQLTIEDLQRRISEQVKELHLDEKLAQGREVLGRNLAAGRDRASAVFSRLYADMEARRGGAAADGNSDGATAATTPTVTPTTPTTSAPVDLGKTQQTAQSVGSKAGSYMSSWAAWAGEKKKAAQASWNGSGGGGGGGGKSGSVAVGAGSGGGGWGFGYGHGARQKTKPDREGSANGITVAQGERDYQIVNSPGSRLSGSSGASTATDDDVARRLTMGSRGSLFSAGSVSMPASPRRRPDSSRSDASFSAYQAPAPSSSSSSVPVGIPSTVEEAEEPDKTTTAAKNDGEGASAESDSVGSCATSPALTGKKGQTPTLEETIWNKRSPLVPPPGRSMMVADGDDGEGNPWQDEEAVGGSRGVESGGLADVSLEGK